MHFQGALYRALNPIYTREPMSGRGAELHGGRFNRKGTPALYFSLSVMTALREANQVGLQLTTLKSYEADTEGVFDSRDDTALTAEGMLADRHWRDRMRAAREAETQAFARRLAAAGYRGLLVSSYAPGATLDRGRTAPFRLTLIDDEERFSR